MSVLCSRARAVGQRWLTTPFTTLYSILSSFFLVARLRPELIICNGPGTCIPICFAAFALQVRYRHVEYLIDQSPYPPFSSLFLVLLLCRQVVGWINCKIIFAESFCRVKELSLSGKLLYPFASKFIVLWPQLVDKYPRAQYLGQLV